MNDFAGHGAPASPHLLNFPLGPTASAVPPAGPIETSDDSRAAKGEGGVDMDLDKTKGACGNCPACKAVDYLDAHGKVVTEVVDLGEGVFLGPDDTYFQDERFEVVMDLTSGIAVLAIDTTNEDANQWWLDQQVIIALSQAGFYDD